MNGHVSIQKISDSIYKVIRGENPRKSLIVQEQGDYIQGANTSAELDGEGLVHFFLDGREVLSEADTEFTQCFQIGENDGIYGLGMHQKFGLNHRNSVLQMEQRNDITMAVPFLTSTAGYAILLDNYSFMSVGIDKPCAVDSMEPYAPEESDPNRINIHAAVDDTFVYYVILAEGIGQQIRHYRTLTGQAPMYPKWAYGFFQSKETYKTQEELLHVAGEFRRRGMPIDCIVQDWNYWEKYGWNAMRWDEKKYPDPEGMVSQLHDMDMRLLLSVWPGFAPESEVCKEVEAVGGILARKNREDEKWGRVHDPLNKEASDIVWKHMNQSFYSIGVDGWWLDATEPAFVNDRSSDLLDCTPCALGDNKAYMNAYAFNISKNIYQHQRATDESKRVYILTRSGFAGQQAYGTSTWTGDVTASWQILKEQLTALLGCGLSGVPYSTTDIGGFFVEYPGGCENPEYRELYLRWFWFGVFSPIFRSHGTSTPREIWNFGEPGTKYYDATMEACKVRYRLMPYLYYMAYRVYRDGDTLMRALVMDYPNDKNVSQTTDTFLFGDSLLVHIVTDFGVEETDVYLPEGDDWYDAYTNEFHKGGTTVRVATPVDRTPIFVKAGSIVLTGQDMQCTARQNEREIQINLYTGADGETCFYQDANDNYNYEQGEYLLIPMAWNEAEGVLTIGEAQGDKSRFSPEKTFTLYVNGTKKTTVSYIGEKLDIAVCK